MRNATLWLTLVVACLATPAWSQAPLRSILGDVPQAVGLLGDPSAPPFNAITIE